jgi:hypothetical protein
LSKAQLPLSQVATALEIEQALPQIMQLLTDLSDASHPLSAFPSQSATPSGQVAVVHTPPAHPVPAQLFPHPPQWARPSSFCSQPLDLSPSQSPYPRSHCT